jgi:hypothetical protein
VKGTCVADHRGAAGEFASFAARGFDGDPKLPEAVFLPAKQRLRSVADDPRIHDSQRKTDVVKAAQSGLVVVDLSRLILPHRSLHPRA